MSSLLSPIGIFIPVLTVARSLFIITMLCFLVIFLCLFPFICRFCLLAYTCTITLAISRYSVGCKEIKDLEDFSQNRGIY